MNKTSFGFDSASSDFYSTIRELIHNTPLASLNLKRNRLGSEVAIALARNPILTALKLGTNRIGYEGATALTLNFTLTSLLWDNLITYTKEQELVQVINRNRSAMFQRRKQFILEIVVLAIDANTINSESIWHKLPGDIRQLILRQLALTLNGCHHLGGGGKLIFGFTKFIFSNIAEVNKKIRDREPIKISQRKSGAFSFFKPLLSGQIKKEEEPLEKYAALYS